MSEKITMIKKDSVINIQVGAGFLQKLHEGLAFIISQQSPESVEAFKTLSQQPSVTEYPEDWMEHCVTLSSLINTIQDEAIKQGHTYEKDINTEGN